jgi:ferredoxin-NADP reductase
MTDALRVPVSQIRDEGCDAKTFRLDLPPGLRLDFRPGQFVMVGFPGEEKKRAFSVGSSPLAEGYIEITATKGPDLSARLFELEGGETLECLPPQGKFTFSDEDRIAVFISEGVGITPLCSMVRYTLDKGLPTRLALFYAERRPSCLLFSRELEDFAKQEVLVHTSVAEVPEGEIWDGPVGPITFKDIRSQVPDYKQAAYYICGRNKVVDAITGPLQKAKVAPEQIHAEKWGDW